MTTLDLNHRLATLLGWTNITETGGALLGTPPEGEPQCRGQARVPDWAGDWRDCGPLMVRHLYEVTICGARITARGPMLSRADRYTRQGEARCSAARAVIVSAVIAKLESTR